MARIVTELALNNEYGFLGLPVSTPFLLSTRPYEAQDILTQNGFGGPFINIHDVVGFRNLWKAYWLARNSEEWVKMWMTA